MKALILVDNVNQVPKNVRNHLYVVSASNWQESFAFLAGKTDSQYIFLHETAPVDRLLKLVENYQGNLAVYTTQQVSPVFMSRFTKVSSRVTTNVTNESVAAFLEKSPNEKLLEHLKSVL